VTPPAPLTAAPVAADDRLQSLVYRAIAARLPRFVKTANSGSTR